MRLIYFIFFIPTLSATAQQFYINPSKPSADSSITFQYSSYPFYKTDSKIACVVYFAGLNDGTKQRFDFPRAQAIALKKSGDFWIGKIDSIPKRANAIVFAFTDSLNNRDTNNGKGYYTPIYENDKPLPGAWAGIGSLLYGNANAKKSAFHIKYDLDSLNKYLQKDSSAPEVVRAYYGAYLNTLKINSLEDELNYRKALEEMGHWPELSHNELSMLRFEYGRLKDTVKANEYERILFKKYPQGSWTVQAKSLKALIAVATTHDFQKQAEIYRQFKETYLKSYEDEFATITMNGRGAQMLGYMTEHFVKEGTIDLWINEVNVLTDDGQRQAYQKAARELLGFGRPKPEKVKTSTQSEHPFLQSSLDEPDLNVKIATDFALRALEIQKKNFNEPRRFNEPLLLTDVEVERFREEQLSLSLELVGIGLMKQNKFSEAVTVLTEAVQKNHYQESTTNQTYIEALVKAGQVENALIEIEKITALGMGTSVIDSFYGKYKTKDNDLAGLKRQSVETAKRMLKRKMLREDISDFVYYDINGNEVKSTSLKNKIVVIDFWASWCAPCLISLKAVSQVIDNFKDDREVVFLLMNEDNSRERAEKIMVEYKNQEAFVFDRDRGLVKKMAAGLPTQIVMDGTGNVRFRTSGLTSFNVHESAIELQAMIELLKKD